MSEPLVPAEATGGRFFVDIGHATAASVSPLHVHDVTDEFVFVLEGSLRITVDDVVHELGVEESVFLPRGVPHRFETLGPARWLIVGPGAYQAERERILDGLASGRSGREVYETLAGLRFVAD